MKKLGIVAALLLAGPAFGQTVQTKAALTNYNNLHINTNGVGGITGAVLNTALNNIVTSMCGLAVSSDCVLPQGQISGAVHVSNNAQLLTLSPLTTTYVHRDGYLVAGDGGAADYAYNPVTCAGLGFAADNGYCVPATTGSWIADFYNRTANVLVWGADPTQSRDSTAAIQAMANFVCGASTGRPEGYIPGGYYLYTGVTLNLPSGTRCKIRGAGPLQTTLYQTGVTGDDWSVTGSGSQQIILSQMALKEITTGHKGSGYAVTYNALYEPELEDVTITGYNGINSVSNATPKYHVNMADLTGVEGIYLHGTVGAIHFGAEIDAIGSAVSNTQINWLDMDSYSYSVTVTYGQFLWGGRCERMQNTAAGGSSAPMWLFNTHLECDHNNIAGVDLFAGSGFTLSPGSWVGSSLAGSGIAFENGWGTGVGSPGGQARVMGSRINGNALFGIYMVAGKDILIEGNTITANGNTAPHYDEISVASGLTNYQIKNNFISNTGDGNNSTDGWCINNVSGGSPANIDISGNQGMTCSTGSIANFLTGNYVRIKNNDNFSPVGTWTPVYSGSGTAGSWTYTVQNGRFFVEDNLITVSATLHTSAVAGGPTNNFIITGLPFQASTGSNQYMTCSVGFYGGFTLTASYTQLMAAVAPATSQINVYEGGSAQSLAAMPVSGVGGATDLQFTCRYSIN